MPENVVTPAHRRGHRWILVLLALSLGTTILLAFFAGTTQTLALLRNANVWFVLGIVAFQILRYVAMTISTRVVSEIVGVRVPLREMFQATVAAQAANRTFVGGAAGLMIRGAFLVQHGMPGGAFAAVESIEDVVSLGVVALMFGSGLAFVVARGGGENFRWDAIAIFVMGALALTGAVLFLVRRRAWVERAADRIARGLNYFYAKITRRNFYSAERVQRAVDDFYRALAFARREPRRVFIAFCCAFARLGCDWVALYFAFHAIGYEIAFGAVLLIFIVSTSVATLAAIPGQVGVMETTLTLMSTALGVPAAVAVSASVLFRVIAFWLPIPFGFAFAWRLEQRGLI